MHLHRLWVDLDDNKELQHLIGKDADYKEPGKTDEDKLQWMASIFSSDYRGVAMCCFDPYNDEAREVSHQCY